MDGLHYARHTWPRSTRRVNRIKTEEIWIGLQSSGTHMEWSENLWWNLKKAVAAQKPSNLNALEAFVWEEWAKIPQEWCQKLDSHTNIAYWRLSRQKDAPQSTEVGVWITVHIDICQEN